MLATYPHPPNERSWLHPKITQTYTETNTVYTQFN